MSMAVVMSEMPDVWRKVLAEHVPDERRLCRACLHDGGRASWPCQTYRIAQEAKWVAEGGLPGTGPHGPGPSRTRVSPPEPTREPSREPEPLASSRASTSEWGSAPMASSYPSTGSWSSPSIGDRSLPSGGGFDDRPLAGDPLGGSALPTTTGERPYGSHFDAPYGSSFGVDDRPHARW
ncbi:hypothetical protein Acsp06_22670 [Actinomycetospora sp. NBRC 106375]|uniref:hypothetical protein n=1 Tax=Actinomycetospora sp. NBRC 106375 TaxID=3032207 RepID=UPI0024A1C4D1|nr:hypothetical protein [Actinomycetospora sp. NBRC 106375]GLZ46082.1 hypothetical protein Acsp06_22670 [Actinomycetospora sp. NBRC 106375]